jgi:hypothetical protein
MKNPLLSFQNIISPSPKEERDEAEIKKKKEEEKAEVERSYFRCSCPRNSCRGFHFQQRNTSEVEQFRSEELSLYFD